jgi:integrase/recombinase XerD
MGPKANPKLKVVAAPSTELQELADDWFADSRARGLSRRSLDMAQAVLMNKTNGLLPWAAARGVTTAQELDQGLLDRLSAYLIDEHLTPQGKPLSRESVRTYMRTVRSFVKWAQKRGRLGAKLATPMPRATKRVLDVLSVEEMRDIEDACATERDKLIVHLLARYGLRLGELLGLREEAIKKERNGRGNETYLLIHGKGSREREVPVTGGVAERLLRFARRPTAERSTGYIFTTARKRDGHYKPLPQRAVQQMIKYAAAEAGIKNPERVHPHLFRHSYATNALKKGINIKAIQENLGHADLSMLTNVYSHLTPSDRYQSMLDLIRRDEEDERHR